MGAHECPPTTWKGSWKAGGEIGTMDLELSTKDGELTGGGSDVVGTFTITGTVDSEALKFKKSYHDSELGPYTVLYDGSSKDGNDYKGKYEIPETDTLDSSSGEFKMTAPSA